MPRRTKTYKPPFLHIYMQAEGETIFTATADRPGAMTASTFSALVKLHPGARRTAVAITLLEVARSMLPEQGREAETISHVVSSLVLDELPMASFVPDDDFPF